MGMGLWAYFMHLFCRFYQTPAFSCGIVSDDLNKQNYINLFCLNLEKIPLPCHNYIMT